jgi:hypothetical protein
VEIHHRPFVVSILDSIVRYFYSKYISRRSDVTIIFPVYVDSNQACNELAFQFGMTALDATLADRSWSIRVTQYHCGYNNLAPTSCTQWFYGQDTAVVTSYNFDGDYHLADQNQVACIRREKGNCRICYSTTAITDIQISGKLADTA